MAEGEKITFLLSKPIQAHGNEVSELSFREPTGGDIIEAGNPVIIDMVKGSITHDERKTSDMLARLASVPPSSIAQLAPRDWVGAAWAITPFFVPTAGI